MVVKAFGRVPGRSDVVARGLAASGFDAVRVPEADGRVEADAARGPASSFAGAWAATIIALETTSRLVASADTKRCMVIIILIGRAVRPLEGQSIGLYMTQ